MATKSIYKNVTIKRKNLCQDLVSALEQAKEKPAKQVQVSKRVEEVKKEQIKSFFGKQ